MIVFITPLEKRMQTFPPLSDELTLNRASVKGRLATGYVWLTDIGSGTHRIVRRGGK